MQKVDSRIENIFAHAVALNQSGRLRNSVFVIDKEVYILNSDRSVMLRFILPTTAPTFEHPVSFKAGDYDSNTFTERDGKIIFRSASGGFVKEKSCGVPGLEPQAVKEIFSNYVTKKFNKVEIKSSIVANLEENLSHVEISGTDGEFQLIQRNIYDGAVITIKKEKDRGMGLTSTDEIGSDFGPIGLRTPDFIALFSFNDIITFQFPTDADGFCRVSGRNYKMTGVVSYCLYDELGNILNVKEETTAAPKPKPAKKKPTRKAPVPK